MKKYTENNFYDICFIKYHIRYYLLISTLSHTIIIY